MKKILRIQILTRGTLKKKLKTYIRGLVGWELTKGTTFPYKFFFVPRTHVLVQILVNVGGKFIFGGKLKADVRRIVWIRRYTERRSDNFRRSQDESQPDVKIIVWSHMSHVLEDSK